MSLQVRAFSNTFYSEKEEKYYLRNKLLNSIIVMIKNIDIN